MTVDDFLQLLDHVKRAAHGWSARCPSHNDKSPSLSIREGEDERILLFCFGGCTTQEVCEALHIPVRELFGPTQRDSAEIRRAREQRDCERRARELAQRERDALADAKRRADRLIASAKHVSIDHWSEAFLDLTLNKLGAAYELIGDCYGK